MKKILILGGTQFIGRTLVEQLQKLDTYDITLFNRQKTQSDLFPDVRKIKGDRETDDVRQIENEAWDYVIDVSCYYPDSLVNVLNSIKSKLKKYILVSTCSVYDDTDNHVDMRDETAPILNCTDDQRTDRTPASYGNRKAECERILMNFIEDYIMLRPALVYGAYDHTDRFYYWLYQVQHNQTLLLPDNGERVFSITYVNDLVNAIIASIETPFTGIYNMMTTPKTSIKQIVEHAEKLLNKSTNKINVTPDFLYRNNIKQWTDMPLWEDGDHFTYSTQKLKKDLNSKLTDFKKSIESTISYYNSLGWKVPKYGITEQVRQELMSKIEQEKASSN